MRTGLALQGLIPQPLDQIGRTDRRAELLAVNAPVEFTMCHAFVVGGLLERVEVHRLQQNANGLWQRLGDKARVLIGQRGEFIAPHNPSPSHTRALAALAIVP